MDSNKANIINSTVLIFIGIWCYLEAPSKFALIPILFGVILLMLLLAYSPFKLLNNDRGIELICVLVMTFSSLLSMIYFIKSFKANRKKSNINI